MARVLQPSPATVSAIHLQRFSVPFEYPVYFTRGLFSPDNPVFAEALTRVEPGECQRFLAFIDAQVAGAQPELSAAIARYARYHAGRLTLAGTPQVLPGGETVKNDPAWVERLQQRLLLLGMDRHAHIVGIGGGALLDMLGYVAATTHRGLRMVRVPTTVLAQADSGVGVKTGVNAFGVKSLLGVFAPPFAVLNDLDLLRTLPPREQRAGMAEAIKVALIRDAAFFAWIEASAAALAAFEPDVTAYLIRRCAELHMHQIAHGGDPFETGSVRPLDFGHWSAHRLEALTAYGLRHGEAVAIGLALDARYSVLQGLLPGGDKIRICRLLERLGFRLWHAGLERRDEAGRRLILDGLREFREHLGGELTITLLRGVGVGVEVHEMDEEAIGHCLIWLRNRDARRCASTTWGWGT